MSLITTTTSTDGGDLVKLTNMYHYSLVRLTKYVYDSSIVHSYITCALGLVDTWADHSEGSIPKTVRGGRDFEHRQLTLLRAVTSLLLTLWLA